MKVILECNDEVVEGFNYKLIGDTIRIMIEECRYQDDISAEHLIKIENYLSLKNKSDNSKSLYLRNAFVNEVTMDANLALNLNVGDMVSFQCLRPTGSLGEAILALFDGDGLYSFFLYQKWYRSSDRLELKLVLNYNEDGWQNEYSTLKDHGDIFCFNHN